MKWMDILIGVESIVEQIDKSDIQSAHIHVGIVTGKMGGLSNVAFDVHKSEEAISDETK